VNIDKVLESIEFKLIDTEFQYLEKTINNLIKNYKQNFQEEGEKYEQAIDDLKTTGEYDEPFDEEPGLDVTYGQMMEYRLGKSFHDLESFSSIINESLLIKHLAYIEKFLVKLSFLVQKKENQIIPPDHNVSGHFTDMLKAVDYVSLVTNDDIKIKDTRNWKIIKLLRTLRHKIAHGQRVFVLTEGVIDDINREISLVEKGIMIPKESDYSHGLAQCLIKASEQPSNPKNEWSCTICDDINVLKDLNKICIEFINEVKAVFKQKYNT
jgi:hypothetical protein